MFEELIEPAKVYFGEENSKIPQSNSELILSKFGKSTLETLIKLKNDFFNSEGCVYRENNFDWDLTFTNVKNNFLKIYPNCSEELINLLWWAYSFYLWKNGYKFDPDILTATPR